MRIVVGLGGNALLRRGESLTAENQARNIERAVWALAALGPGNDLVIVHGNGPQVGLLALQDAAMPEAGNFPLDVLSAETVGMVGYPVAQALRNELGGRQVASLLTQVEVDPQDPAFRNPTKPIGPVYGETEARELAERRGWTVARDGEGWRRVVPSPAPVRILELDTIRLLVEAGVVLLCAGGGGIPVVLDRWGCAHGVEAVIDKDRAAALLARELHADVLLFLTDVPGVQAGRGTPGARVLSEVKASEIGALELDAGSMGPKADAAAEFVRAGGGTACIGRLEDAALIVAGRAGTRVVDD